MAGLPYLLRAAGYGLRRPNVAGLGSELAGVVEAVGAKVTGLEPGEAVQDGRHVNPGPALTLDLDVGPDGHVTRVGATSSLPAGALGSLGLDRLLAESRPPLPARGVRLRDRWNADLAAFAPTASGGGGSTIDLPGTGRLEHFPPAVAAGADAVLAASVFHFGQLRIGEVKDALRAGGHVVR